MKLHPVLRRLFVAAFLALPGGAVRADIAPYPRPSGDSKRPADPPPDPAPAEKACAAATGLLIFALGAAAAWRLSRTRDAGKAAEA